MLDTFDVIVRLLSATVAGAALGWERSAQQKPAGLRTHMLVTLGAAAFMVAAIQFDASTQEPGAARNDDLQKVIAGVIGGVGFLGAGSIIQSRGSIHGLTTAASIWLAAAIGVACGLRYYEIAVTTVVLALCILFFLGIVESKWLPEQEKVQPAEPEKTDGE